MPKTGPDYTQSETEDGTVAYRKPEVDIKTKKKSKNHCHTKNTFSTKTYFSKNLRKHAMKF